MDVLKIQKEILEKEFNKKLDELTKENNSLRKEIAELKYEISYLKDIYEPANRLIMLSKINVAVEYMKELTQKVNNYSVFIAEKAGDLE